MTAGTADQTTDTPAGAGRGFHGSGRGETPEEITNDEPGIRVRESSSTARHVPGGIAGLNELGHIADGPDQSTDRLHPFHVPGGIAGDGVIQNLVPHQPADRIIAGHIDGGGAVPHRPPSPAHQAAHFILAGHLARGVVFKGRPVDSGPQQAAHRMAAGHVGGDQGDAPDSVAVDRSEQTDLILGVPVDEQVGHGATIALEIGNEGRGGCTDRVPTVTAVPVVVVRVDVSIVVGVEVQVLRQLVARAAAVAGTPHSESTHGVGGVIRHPGCAVHLAIAVQVVPQGVQLRQIGDVDETVVIGIVVPVSRRDRDRERSR